MLTNKTTKERKDVQDNLCSDGRRVSGRGEEKVTAAAQLLGRHHVLVALAAMEDTMEGR